MKVPVTVNRHFLFFHINNIIGTYILRPCCNDFAEREEMNP
ncbi:hypothetical protein CLOBOL_06116 [Enterocloster bolteae ATCC BAA-613]|uniref:Uncharacterized protein n=1 Tax=Enterocloster bolteae (strain ATCC BAA-613 / DSM 15670 / CCUG 46953 / JCM 12243 / WAL 16351) TaxID=411902 RepID=A8S1P0_ENTBW|nr:hypothetical protein CLOBOL_06116 [Enterocloster bolteae ATCC BAA-613]